MIRAINESSGNRTRVLIAGPNSGGMERVIGRARKMEILIATTHDELLQKISNIDIALIFESITRSKGQKRDLEQESRVLSEILHKIYRVAKQCKIILLSANNLEKPDLFSGANVFGRVSLSDYRNIDEYALALFKMFEDAVTSMEQGR